MAAVSIPAQRKRKGKNMDYQHPNNQGEEGCLVALVFKSSSLGRMHAGVLGGKH